MDKTLGSDQLQARHITPSLSGLSTLPIISLLYFPVKEPLRSLSDSHPPLQQRPEELQVVMLNWVWFFQ